MAETTRIRIGTPTARKGIFAALVLIVGFTLIVEFLGAATDDTRPSQGRRGSSYNAGDDGTRAYIELLDRYDFNVRRARTLDENTIKTNETAIVIDPVELRRSEAEVLQNFVRSGGHLIIGGGYVDVSNLSSQPPQWQSERRENWTVSTPNEFNDAQRLLTASEGYWVQPGNATPIVGDENAALLVRETLGAGSIDFVADATLFNNALIAEADNAAFAVGMADNGTRNVVFVELDGSAEPAQGFSALPNRWKLAILVFVLAAALFAWSTAQRFGPPEARERELAPARGEYIEAMGAALARSKDMESNRGALCEKTLRTLRRDRIDADEVSEIALLHHCDAHDLSVLLGHAPATDAFAAARAFAAIQTTSNLMQSTGKDRS